MIRKYNEEGIKMSKCKSLPDTNNIDVYSLVVKMFKKLDG